MGNSRSKSHRGRPRRSGRDVDLQRLLLRKCPLSLSLWALRLWRLFWRPRDFPPSWRASFRHYWGSVLRSILLFLHSAAGRVSIEDGDVFELSGYFDPGYYLIAVLVASRERGCGYGRETTSLCG